MVSGKYIKDYTLQNVLGADGKLHTVAVYTGPLFRFKADGEALRRARRSYLIWMTACIAAALIPLLLVSPMLRLWYVMIPLALAIAPVVKLVHCATYLLRKERFIRRERDAAVSALAPWSIVLTILSALSLVGQIVYFAGGSFTPAELPAALAAAVLAAAAIRIYFLRRAFETEEVPPKTPGTD